MRGVHEGDGPPLPSVFFPIDALLGVDGAPQSGTGQATIVTGRNASALFGRHFGPWVPTVLRPMVREENLLVRAATTGRSTAFANAYPPGWPGARERRAVAGIPLAAHAAGLMTRHAGELARGEALASGIVNDGWIRELGPSDLPRPTPAEAGALLAGIASGHDLTLFAHYATDTAGHLESLSAGVEALERVDAFLGGLLAALPPDHHLLIVSDHGNIEDVREGHTRNPALGVAVGAGAEALADQVDSLTEITPAVLERIEAG